MEVKYHFSLFLIFQRSMINICIWLLVHVFIYRNIVSFFSDGTWANSKCFNPEGNITFNQSAAFLKHGLSENLTESPVEQYWK